MINKLKHNTKIKIISFLSAIALWMYVMAVVDPEGSKLIEDVPVSINNMSALKDENLVMYPEKSLTVDVYIKGSLSKIQSVKKDEIRVSGSIENPIEGVNQLYLNANVPQGVTLDFKHEILAVNLERTITQKRDIKVEVSGKSKDNINKIELSKDNINITGPRSLVNEVKIIRANLDVGSETEDLSRQLNLIPVNSSGNKVDDVKLSSSYVTANVELLKEKTVPIRLNLKKENQNENTMPNYKLSKEEVVIKGRKEAIDKINYIKTKEVYLTGLADGAEKEVSLDIPDGITAKESVIIVKLDETKQLTAQFIYTPEEIELRNIPENVDKPNIVSNISVQVTVESTEDLSKLNKKDILLYIDLSETTSENNKYKIKYETIYQFKKINIEPNIVEVR